MIKKRGGTSVAISVRQEAEATAVGEVERPARSRGRRHGSEISGREALLGAALSAFAANGYEATSLRAIAASADVDMALVARLFGSKMELWVAVVDHLAERQAVGRQKLMTLAILAAHDPAEAMRRFIRMFVEISYHGPEVPAFIMQESGSPSERLDILAERLLCPFQKAYGPIIDAAIRAGVVKAPHPELFTRMMFCAISMPMARSALSPNGYNAAPHSLDAIAEQAIALFVAE
jgi:AcrR family transcriptional regulator